MEPDRSPTPFEPLRQAVLEVIEELRELDPDEDSPERTFLQGLEFTEEEYQEHLWELEQEPRQAGDAA